MASRGDTRRVELIVSPACRNVRPRAAVSGSSSRINAAAEIWLTCSIWARVPTGSCSRAPSWNDSATESRARKEIAPVAAATRGVIRVTRPTSRPFTRTRVSVVMPSALATRT